MNPSPAELTAITTFVVRFWREWTGAEGRWRGRIEHVQSGQRMDFLCLEDMLDFLQRMGVSVAQITDDDQHETSSSLLRKGAQHLRSGREQEP